MSYNEVQAILATAFALAGQDHSLIVACNLYSATNDSIAALFSGPNAVADDDARDIAKAPLEHTKLGLLGIISNIELRAVTFAGMQARARAAAAHSGDGNPRYDGRITGQAEGIAHCLLRDLIECPDHIFGLV